MENKNDAGRILEFISSNSRLHDSDIARCLNVTRQAILKWGKGLPAAKSKVDKLAEIRDAVQILKSHGIDLTRSMFRQKIDGPSIWDTVASGRSAQEAASRLAEFILHERERLAASQPRTRQLAMAIGAGTTKTNLNELGRPANQSPASQACKKAA